MLNTLYYCYNFLDLYSHVNDFVSTNIGEYKWKQHICDIDNVTTLRIRESRYHVELYLNNLSNSNIILEFIQSKCKYLLFNNELDIINTYVIIYNVDSLCKYDQNILKAIIEKHKTCYFLCTTCRFSAVIDNVKSLLFIKLIKCNIPKHDYIITLLKTLDINNKKQCREYIYKLLVNNIQSIDILLSFKTLVNNKSYSINTQHSICNLLQKANTNLVKGEREIYHLENFLNELRLYLY